MPQKSSPQLQPVLARRRFNFLEIVLRERSFLLLIVLGFTISGIFYQVHSVAMWLGFIFAGYAAVANDSIQTLGTFIVSNARRPWWILWLFAGLIFLAVVSFSWIVFDGDVTYQRIYNPSKYPDLPQHSPYPQPTAEQGFSFIQVVAPLILLVLTRLRMPVSTTFLLLSCFSASASGISSVFVKSVSGYGMAFVLSMVIWIGGYSIIRKFFSGRRHAKGWIVAQWLISGTLWGVWLMQDAANIAVYLPRQLNIWEFLGFAGLIFAGLGLLMYQRGDKIQNIVSEKKRIDDVRAATLIDFSYAIMLIYKLFISTVPMSTTWVFLGIIGGREIAISIMRKKSGFHHKRIAIKMVLRDVVFALIGLLVSIILALAVNQQLIDELL